MSKYFSKKYKNLVPYTPGEQPKDTQYIKLNTNESPYNVPDEVNEFINNARALRLYCDCDCIELTNKLAEVLNVDSSEVILSNGSDEILNFAFMGYCDSDTPAIFPNVTYGFYEVFAQINNVSYTTVPLKNDFSIDIKDYFESKKTIFIANPNAWTGVTLSVNEIEEIVKNNPNNMVVVDEAYVDFGADSAIPLIKKYDNILVTGTFSKSRSMAGARLGFGVGCKSIIQDMNTIKYSTNPYNINSLTQAAGLGVLMCDDKMRENMKKIICNREYLVRELKNLGFEMPRSKANFILTRCDKIKGKDLYEKLKQEGILVRHSNQEEICDYVRITIGNMDQMQILVDKIKKILDEYVK